jgi:hypothetical protein
MEPGEKYNVTGVAEPVAETFSQGGSPAVKAVALVNVISVPGDCELVTMACPYAYASSTTVPEMGLTPKAGASARPVAAISNAMATTRALFLSMV